MWIVASLIMDSKERSESFDSWVEQTDALLTVPEIRAALGVTLAEEMQMLNGQAFLPNIRDDNVSIPKAYRDSNGHAVVPTASALGVTLTRSALMPTPERRQKMLEELRTRNISFAQIVLGKELVQTVWQAKERDRRIMGGYPSVTRALMRTPVHGLDFIGRSYLSYMARENYATYIRGATCIHELLHVRDSRKEDYSDGDEARTLKVLREMRGHAAGAIVIRHGLATGALTPGDINDSGSLSLRVDQKRERLGISTAALFSHGETYLPLLKSAIGDETNLYRSR